MSEIFAEPQVYLRETAAKKQLERGSNSISVTSIKALPSNKGAPFSRFQRERIDLLPSFQGVERKGERMKMEIGRERGRGSEREEAVLDKAERCCAVVQKVVAQHRQPANTF